MMMSDPIEELRHRLKTWSSGDELSREQSNEILAAYDAKCAELEKVKEECEDLKESLAAELWENLSLFDLLGLKTPEDFGNSTSTEAIRVKIKEKLDGYLAESREWCKRAASLSTALDSERAANAGLREEVLSLKADIETAILALRNSYDATEWPADGTSGCEIAAKALEERLNTPPTTETKIGE